LDWSWNFGFGSVLPDPKNCGHNIMSLIDELQKELEHAKGKERERILKRIEEGSRV